MNDLTDLEICKRLADIEGHKTLSWNEYQEGDFYIVIDDHGEGYSPLTDDALCFQLMVKYEVNVDSYLGVTSISSDYTDRRDIARVSYMDYTINKAICLTIIEAHKDQS